MTEIKSWHPNTPDLPDLSDEAAAYVAKWWADHLRERTISNNGDPMHGMLKAMINEKVEITTEEVDTFERVMREYILSPENPDKDDAARPNTWKEDGVRIHAWRHQFSTDYGPDHRLRAVIQLCAPNDVPAHGCAFNENKIAGLLPWKSDTRIHCVGVKSAGGYGADRTEYAWKAYGLERNFKVLDRWRPSGNYEHGTWINGGDKDARLAIVALDPASVQPTPIAYVFRGKVSIRGYGKMWEDDLLSCMDRTGGYLALVKLADVVTPEGGLG